MRKPAFEPIVAARPSRRNLLCAANGRSIFAEAGRRVDTPTYDRTKLVAGNRIAGPALIEEYARPRWSIPRPPHGRRLRRPGHRILRS